MNRTALWLPLGWFFGVSSALLCILAISFAGSGLYALVASGYLSPRPVHFPEVPWLGIHPDLTSLTVQLAILLVIAGAGVVSFRRRGGAGDRPERRAAHGDPARQARLPSLPRDGGGGGAGAGRARHPPGGAGRARGPGLLRRYRNDIPVLLEGDVELARHRVTPEELVSG